MKYALIQIGGHQFRVQEGDRVVVHRLSTPEGEAVSLDRVLALRTEKGFQTGKPTLDGVRVVARVVRHFKGKKVLVFHFKRRKNVHKLRGHRQPLTELEILQIEGS